MQHDAVTYFVGSELPSISIQTLGDLHEVVNLVHTLVIDAKKISEPHRDAVLRHLESALNAIEELDQTVG